MDFTLVICLSFTLAIILGVLIGYILFSPRMVEYKKVSKDTLAGSIARYLTKLLSNKETSIRKERMPISEVKFNFGIMSITFAKKENKPLKGKENDESEKDS